jgi:hypothetical protein
LPLFTPRQALFHHQHLLNSQDDDHRTRVSWGSALSVPRRPPQLRPDPASTAAGQQRNDACTSATGITRSTQDPGPFTVPSSTSPRHPGDGRPLPGHAATATSTAPIEPSSLRHRLRVLGTPEPSLDPIKERAEGSLSTREENRRFSPLQRSTSQATPYFTFLLRLGTGSLSHSL